MKTTDQWRLKDGAFIPAPLVYLNQQRWDGAEIPEIVTESRIDPALVKIEQDSKRAIAMPDDVRAKLAALRKGMM
jgi:acyl-CoA thioesterase FadM